MTPQLDRPGLFTGVCRLCVSGRPRSGWGGDVGLGGGAARDTAKVGARPMAELMSVG